MLAYVAGSGDLSSARHVDGIQARRQAGSTLKPFLYARALDRRLLTAASLLDDTPLEIAVGRGLFRPRNYDEQFRGPGLAAHRAGRLAQRSGRAHAACWSAPTTSPTQLRALGFVGVAQPGDYYGPSLALGSADVTCGSWSTPTARSPTAACGRAAASRRASAARRAAGPRHARMQRRPAALHRLRHPRRSRRAQRHLRAREPAGDALLERGEDGHQQGHARQLVRRLLAPLHRRRLGGQLFRRADARRQRRQRRGADLGRRHGLAAPRSAQRCAAAAARHPRASRRSSPTAPKPARREWYLAGTEPARGDVGARAGAAHRRARPTAAVIAIDPDIPAARQRVAFDGRTPPARDALDRLDGGELGAAGAAVAVATDARRSHAAARRAQPRARSRRCASRCAAAPTERRQRHERDRTAADRAPRACRACAAGLRRSCMPCHSDPRVMATLGGVRSRARDAARARHAGGALGQHGFGYWMAHDLARRQRSPAAAGCAASCSTDAPRSRSATRSCRSSLGPAAWRPSWRARASG